MICALAAVVRVPGMKDEHRMMTFVVVKEALDGDPKPFTRYLLTNALGVSASEVVRTNSDGPLRSSSETSNST